MKLRTNYSFHYKRKEKKREKNKRIAHEMSASHIFYSREYVLFHAETKSAIKPAIYSCTYSQIFDEHLNFFLVCCFSASCNVFVSWFSL